MTFSKTGTFVSDFFWDGGLYLFERLLSRFSPGDGTNTAVACRSLSKSGLWVLLTFGFVCMGGLTGDLVGDSFSLEEEDFRGAMLKDVGRFIKGFGFTEGLLSDVLDKGLFGRFSDSVLSGSSDFVLIMALCGSGSGGGTGLFSAQDCNRASPGFGTGRFLLGILRSVLLGSVWVSEAWVTFVIF